MGVSPTCCLRRADIRTFKRSHVSMSSPFLQKCYIFNTMRENSKMFATVEEAVEEIRQGRMVVLVDDEDRENEGDLAMAAEKITPDAINFMAKYGRGLICLAMTEQRCDALDLKPISARNTTAFGPPFCGP